jgi:hypothetical protein
MPDAELPQWLDRVEARTIAVLTLDDGECLTADILEFNEERDELIVDVVSSNHLHQKGKQRRAIPAGRVVSCEPRSRAEQPWPYSDPCRKVSFSFARFGLLAMLFLSQTIGSIPLFLLLMKRPYGVQEASAIVYTLFVAFHTFAATRDIRPYMFTCPAVQTQIPGLLSLHVGFLAALFAFQTLALVARPNLPDWWNAEDAKGGTPFVIAFALLSLGLGFTQVFYNRSRLARAHREFSS